MIVAPAAVALPGFLKENLAAALAYFTFIPAIVFLRLREFSHNRLVRFHAFQSIFLSVAAVLIALILRIIFSVLSWIPRFGYLFGSLIVLVVALGLVFVWLVATIKAFQGELFKLPIIGGFAERA